jgi:ribosomal protein S18 acetylase RimI-like enzyme
LYGVFCSAHEDQFSLLELALDEKEQLMTMQFHAQQAQYNSQYPDADYDLVLKDDMAIGVLFAQRGPDEFVLVDITLLPQHRNSGIGAVLIRDLIRDAQSACKPLRAHVLKQNPAWRLWQRLGFRLLRDDGAYLSIEVSASSIRKY